VPSFFTFGTLARLILSDKVRNGVRLIITGTLDFPAYSIAHAHLELDHIKATMSASQHATAAAGRVGSRLPLIISESNN